MNVSIRQIALKKILFLYCSFCVFNTNAQTVTTFAGSTQGYLDGIGTGAQFYGPAGVALAADGTLYVADRMNHRIRKITSDGAVTTLAGSGLPGFSDGLGTVAQFKYPMGIAVDAAGNVFVADSNNHRIRKITTDGMVTTIAGSANGYTNGTISTALFSYPEGVAVDATGTLYVGDTANHSIRKITTDGAVTTLAGNGINHGYADGPGVSAKFWTPCGVVVDFGGIVYVAEKQGNRIRKITTDGVVSTLAGSGVSGFADGSGTAAMFQGSFHLSLDATGNVYVADGSNNRIRKITPLGVVTTLAGSSQGYLDGVGSGAKFRSPIGISVAVDGTVFVGESGNNRIRKITNNLATNNYISENEITIYPNPASTLINVALENLIPIKITIFDINGRALTSENTYHNKTDIYVGNLVDGIYIIQIITDKGIYSKKFVKNRF